MAAGQIGSVYHKPDSFSRYIAKYPQIFCVSTYNTFFRVFAAQNCSLFSPVFRSLYPKSTKFYQRSVFGIKSLICAGKRARIFTKLSQIPRILNKICCFYPKKTAPPVDFGPNLCIMIYRRIRICISFRRPFAVSFWLRAAYRWCLDDDLNERRGISIMAKLDLSKYGITGTTELPHP